MLKEQGSEAKGREIKSRRERELEELRSRGVAKARREKLKNFSAPLRTALESKQYILENHDPNKRDSFGMPTMHPSNMSAVDYTSFLMAQSKRQRELKMRRREAEQLLHGFRGFYGESFASWSPRHAKRDRNSFGIFPFSPSDSLPDPDDDSSSRRQTAYPRLETEWEPESRDDNYGYGKTFQPKPLDPHRRDFFLDNRNYDGTEGHDDNYRHGKRSQPNPLDPHRRDFLVDDRHYDGTRYSRTQQDMEVASGVTMFSPREDWRHDNYFREGIPSSTRSLISTRKGFFQDFKDGEVERQPLTTRSLTSADIGFFENSRNSEFDNQFRERLLSTKRSSTSTEEQFDQAPLDASVDAFSGAMERNAAELDVRNSQTERGSKDFQSPYTERRPKLQINTEREDQIDVSASKHRLREAVSTEERDGSAESRYIGEEERSRLSNTSSEKDKEQASNASKINAHTQKIGQSESMPQDESNFYKRKTELVPVTIWRNYVSDEPGAKFPPEAGRYHLYASYACPGSHRALIVRALKGLEDIISVTIVHPTWRHTNPDNPRDKHRGWIFGDPNGKPFHNTMGRGGPFPPMYHDTTPDPILNAFSVRNLYEYAKDTSGKYTIPLLWDKKLNTIVNNESSDISYMLNSSFNDFAKNPELDLYTEDDEEGLDRLNEVSQWLYPMMIHGVYRCGFAKTQRAYDIAIEELTRAFDAADELLQRQRYLTGDVLTDADIRFFVTLIRFDEVYAFYFRANTRLVLMTPSLLNFCREIYQMPGVAKTCEMDQIKAHFFGSHAEWNKYSVVPRGLDFMRYLKMPHDREKLSLGHC